MGRAAAAAVVTAVICLGGLGLRQSTAPTVVSADRFVLMPWELQHEKQALLDESGHGLDSLRACGFDTVAFVRPDQVATVEKAGMRALVGRPGDLRLRWPTLLDRAIVAHVGTLVDASGKSDAILGYFLADEPRFCL
jgi:hypothetical protein